MDSNSQHLLIYAKLMMVPCMMNVSGADFFLALVLYNLGLATGLLFLSRVLNVLVKISKRGASLSQYYVCLVEIFCFNYQGCDCCIVKQVLDRY